MAQYTRFACCAARRMDTQLMGRREDVVNVLLSTCSNTFGRTPGSPWICATCLLKIATSLPKGLKGPPRSATGPRVRTGSCQRRESSQPAKLHGGMDLFEYKMPKLHMMWFYMSPIIHLDSIWYSLWPGSRSQSGTPWQPHKGKSKTNVFWTFKFFLGGGNVQITWIHCGWMI